MLLPNSSSAFSLLRITLSIRFDTRKEHAVPCLSEDSRICILIFTCHFLLLSPVDKPNRPAVLTVHFLAFLGYGNARWIFCLLNNINGTSPQSNKNQVRQYNLALLLYPISCSDLPVNTFQWKSLPSQLHSWLNTKMPDKSAMQWIKPIARLMSVHNRDIQLRQQTPLTTKQKSTQNKHVGQCPCQQKRLRCKSPSPNFTVVVFSRGHIITHLTQGLDSLIS